MYSEIIIQYIQNEYSFYVNYENFLQYILYMSIHYPCYIQ